MPKIKLKFSGASHFLFVHFIGDVHSLIVLEILSSRALAAFSPGSRQTVFVRTFPVAVRFLVDCCTPVSEVAGVVSPAVDNYAQPVDND